MNEFLEEVKGDEESQKNALRKVFSQLMKSDPVFVESELQSLVSELQDDNGKLASVVKRVHSEFPGDVGVLCLYFLNIVDLKPGEAIFHAPDEPHSYLRYC